MNGVVDLMGELRVCLHVGLDCGMGASWDFYANSWVKLSGGGGRLQTFPKDLSPPYPTPCFYLPPLQSDNPQIYARLHGSSLISKATNPHRFNPNLVLPTYKTTHNPPTNLSTNYHESLV